MHLPMALHFAGLGQLLQGVNFAVDFFMSSSAGV